MTMNVYIVSIALSENFDNIPYPYGFSRNLAVVSSYDEATDYIKSQFDEDEVFTDFEENHDFGNTTFFFTNYATYRIERKEMWIPS